MGTGLRRRDIDSVAADGNASSGLSELPWFSPSPTVGVMSARAHKTMGYCGIDFHDGIL